MEVVAPVGQYTVIELPFAPTAVLTLEQGTFRGTVQLSKELNKHVVTLAPAAGADTADLFIVEGGTRIKTLRIIPIAVTQETSALESQAEIPDPESRDYTVYSETKEPGRDFYNGARRDNLRTIRISGRRLNIRPRGAQGIFERLMPGGAAAANIRTVELYGQEVIIGAPLRIPGADIKVFAENLRFEDHDNTVGSLDTTPLPPAAETVPGVDGRNGEKGGDVYLHVNQIASAGNTSAVRIKANGGVGQKGGPETPGQKGADKGLLPHEPQIGGIVRSWNDLAPFRTVQGDAPLPSDWHVYATAKNVVWFRRFGRWEWGNENQPWPGNGTQGRAGGRPGIGGKGGTVRSVVPVASSLLELAGGSSGEKRPNAISGAPGNPELSIGIALERQGFFTFYRFHVHRAVSLPNVTSPSASQPQGDTGINQVDLKRGWLHSNAAQAILTYAEDLYRMGFMIKAQEELQSLLLNLESPDVITEPEDAYVAIKQRVNSLQARISENLDYYGHPAGFVPTLSLAGAINLLQSEVATSGRILAVAERVRMDAEAGEANIDHLRTIRDAAQANVIGLSDELDTLAQSVPQLTAEAAAVAQDEENLLLNCRQREDQLRRDADRLANPEPSFLVKAVKTIGTLAKVCPVGQPMLGAVGGVIDFATTLDQRTPWDSITAIPSLARGFSRENVASSMQSFRQTVTDIGNLNLGNRQRFFSTLSTAAKDIGTSMAAFKQAQDLSRAPADKVDQIFQNLKASDGPYRDLLQSASTLTARKRLLSEKIDGSIQEMGEVTSKVASLTNNIDALNSQLTSTQDRIDHPAVQATKDIGRQIRERLDFYHYILMKSFEYFTATPYRGNRRASGTADGLAQLLTNNNRDPQLAAQAFETVYTNEVRGAGRQIVNMLDAQGQRNKKSIDVALNASELATLNSSLVATNGADLFINLEDRSAIPVTDLEARLLNVEVVECDCVIPSAQVSNATLHIDFSVPQSGVIQTQNARLSFRRSVKATLWGATVDLTTQPTRPRVNQQAEDVGQVLESFINPAGRQRSYIAPPPAFPGFMIRARFESDAAQPLTPRIRRLRLKLTYSSTTSSVVRAIRVTSTTPNGMVPFIYASLPDASGRRSGQANFTRVYETDAPVELVAPTNLGTSRFIGWFRDQTRITTQNHVEVPVRMGSYRFEARYR